MPVFMLAHAGIAPAHASIHTSPSISPSSFFKDCALIFKNFYEPTN